MAKIDERTVTKSIEYGYPIPNENNLIKSGYSGKCAAKYSTGKLKLKVLSISGL